jgi:hypothetical protein
MLPIMLNSAYRAFICWDDRRYYQAEYDKPAYRLEDLFDHRLFQAVPLTSLGGFRPSRYMRHKVYRSYSKRDKHCCKYS